MHVALEDRYEKDQSHFKGPCQTDQESQTEAGRRHGRACTQETFRTGSATPFPAARQDDGEDGANSGAGHE